MPRTWTSEIALASGGVALSVAAGALGAKLAGAVDDPGLSEAIRRFIAAGVSGAVAKTVTAPLEAIKLKLQYTEDDDEGPLDCARRIFEREGWQGFYRGNLANVLRYFPTQAFNFAFKDKIKGLFPKVNRKKHPWRALAVNIVMGGVAGAGSLSLVYPLDSVRTQLIICTNDDGSPKYANMADFVRENVKTRGDILKLYSGLYEGYVVSVVGIIPFRAIYFIVNDTLRSILPWIRDEGLKGFVSKFTCAQVAALCAANASYPFDTVRRRLQADAQRPLGERRYKGNLDCLKKIYRVEGLGALYRGAGYNALRTITSALALVAYGELKKRKRA
jgi:solute carrier family 25 (adenine nucleotide translocator) protein 4/5/6/31